MSSNLSQLQGSIDKLFHYLLVYVTSDTSVTVRSGENIFSRTYIAPREISISPTLYTRIDDCHGAGNCCRVPFDLVYTGYDRQRIENYDYGCAKDMFGVTSADNFLRNRDDLLKRLRIIDIQFDNGNRQWSSRLYVKINEDLNPLSGNKSCPYLLMSDDRYFCGVHPFKPLHCWYPHMTVRVNRVTSRGARPSVSIGRMQYGRNHKFGCPVLFTEHHSSDDGALFSELQVGSGPSYFDEQFDSDISKLSWTSKSASSLGFTSENNFVVGIDEQLFMQEAAIREALADNRHQPLTLWNRKINDHSSLQS